MGWTAIALVVFFVVVVPVLLYNKLVQARNHCDEAWSDVDTGAATT